MSSILESIGALDCLVACTKYCIDIVPELGERQILVVSDSWTTQSHEVLAARPDLVIASVPYQEKAVVEILQSGAKFLGLVPKTLADIYSDIAIISGIMNRRDRGLEVIAHMQQEIASLRARTQALPRKRVYCEEWGKPLIASQPWVAELIDAAGGESIVSAGAQTTAEAIAALDPDVIVAAWCGAGDRVPLEKIVTARGWQDLKAVRGGEIYCIRDEFLNTPATTLLRGLRALAAAIHPENFDSPDGLRKISVDQAA